MIDRYRNILLFVGDDDEGFVPVATKGKRQPKQTAKAAAAAAAITGTRGRGRGKAGASSSADLVAAATTTTRNPQQGKKKGSSICSTTVFECLGDDEAVEDEGKLFYVKLLQCINLYY